MSAAQQSSSSVERTRAGYAAFAAGDLDAVRALFAPGIAWHVPGRSSLAGTYRGPDAVIGYFLDLFERSGGTVAIALQECGEIAPGVVAAVARMTADMPVSSIDQTMVTIYREDAEGLIVEATTYAFDPQTVDEAVGPIAIALPDARKATEPAIT
jgi:uncharacterized protein